MLCPGLLHPGDPDIPVAPGEEHYVLDPSLDEDSLQGNRPTRSRSLPEVTQPGGGEPKHLLLLHLESQGRGSLVGCHLWGHTESDVTEET